MVHRSSAEVTFSQLWDQEEAAARGTLDEYLERQQRWRQQAREMPRAKRVHYFTTELRNMQAYIDQDFRPYALQINQPTLVVQGTNDQLVKLDWAKELTHTIPSACLAIVEGRSHSLMIRNAQARQPAISFMQQVDSDYASQRT